MPETRLKWRVLREREGDRFYREGETREGTRSELGHLEGRVLEESGEAIAERAPRIKAESAAPANKAARSRTSKRK